MKVQHIKICGTQQIMQRGKYTALNNLSFHLQNLEKEEKNKHKANGKKKIRKIRAEIKKL